MSNNNQDFLSNEPVEGWEYIFMNNGLLGVGEVIESGPEYSVLEWEVKVPTGDIIKKNVIVNNNNLMNAITDVDEVIQRIKKSFDDNYVMTEKESAAWGKHLKKLYGK